MPSSSIKRTTLLIILLSFSQAAMAQIPVETFAKLPDIRDLSLSPTGEYLAASVPRGDRTGLVVVRLDDMEAVTAKDFGAKTHVFDLEWVSDERVLGEIGETFGSLEQPSNAGELFAIDADGTTFTYLIGYRSSFRGTASLIDPRPGDERYAIIATRPFTEGINTIRRGIDRRVTAERIDVVSSRRDKLAGAPIKGPGEFLTDSSGFVRFFKGSGEDSFSTRSFQRLPGAPDEWTEYTLKGLDNVAPHTTSDAGTYVVAQDREQDARTECLFRTGAGQQSTEKLACRDDVSLAFVARSSDGTRPIRAYFQPGRFESINLAPDLAEGKLLEAIQARFEPNVVIPQGWSADGNRLLFTVAGDKVPGEVFMFDRKQRKATFLLSKRPWIEPAKMAERTPIEYTSRDGLTIRGYLTRPTGQKTTKLPLVVLPHGGPIGVRDSWLWDSDAQFLASRGFAVLQVNFRGSGGYGGAFLDAGRKQWGLGMIDDIIDGTEWAVESGYADPNRMCIYGASYGGYASLMAAIREPDLFKCVVGYVGVYDLETMARTTDITQSNYGQSYFESFVGENEEELRAQSPMRRLDELKAPMLIVHGEEDKRAPFSEAEALRDALRDRKHPHEWMTRRDEGHGFYALENRVDFYETLLAFLNQHIGNSGT